MHAGDRRRALRTLDDALAGREDALEEIARSPELRAQWKDLSALRSLLRHTADTSSQNALRPFLADRVLRRIRPADEALFGSLWHLFRPLALAGILLIVGFASYNATFYRSYDAQPTATEVMLGLRPVTLTTAYAADLDTFLPLTP